MQKIKFVTDRAKLFENCTNKAMQAEKWDRIQNRQYKHAFFSFTFNIEINVKHNKQILVMSNYIYSCAMQIFIARSYPE